MQPKHPAILGAFCLFGLVVTGQLYWFGFWLLAVFAWGYAMAEQRHGGSI